MARLNDYAAPAESVDARELLQYTMDAKYMG